MFSSVLKVRTESLSKLLKFDTHFISIYISIRVIPSLSGVNILYIGFHIQ